MKRLILLGVALGTIWLLWSGHFTLPFLWLLGLLSVMTTVWMGVRMHIVDDEGAPIGLGIRPVIYGFWLLIEIIKANIEVTKLILDPKLPIRPRLIRVPAPQKTALGRVILANSITLTPGTVSVDVEHDHIWVHALSFEGAEEDLSGEMTRRICELER